MPLLNTVAFFASGTVEHPTKAIWSKIGQKTTKFLCGESNVKHLSSNIQADVIFYTWNSAYWWIIWIYKNSKKFLYLRSTFLKLSPEKYWKSWRKIWVGIIKCHEPRLFVKSSSQEFKTLLKDLLMVYKKIVRMWFTFSIPISLFLFKAVSGEHGE